MWVTRARLGSALEWALAAGCILALAALVSLVVQEVRGIRPLTPVLADEMSTALPAPEAPPTIPPGAISVPLLLLSNGAQIQVGQRVSDVSGHISTAWQVGAEAIERTTHGERVTRLYDDGARRFLLVIEGSEDGVEQVGAIYLH